MIVKDAGWRHIQSRFAEWQNGLLLFLWGLFLLRYPSIFSDARTGDYWKGMVSMAPQPVWGIVASAIGLGRLIALWINGRVKATPAIRLAASFCSAFVICQICLGLLKSGLPVTGQVLWPILLLGDLYSAYRASADMTMVARKHKAELGRGGKS